MQSEGAEAEMRGPADAKKARMDRAFKHCEKLTCS